MRPRLLLPLSVFVLIAVDCAPPLECGFGERASGGECVASDTLIINVDERSDGVCDEDGACTFRRGIGVNVCPVRAFTEVAAAESGQCALFQYAGRSLDETFSADAGLVFVALFDGPVQLQPSTEQDCYESDLFPARDDLFQTGDEFSVTGFGGADIPGFDAVLTAPGPLIVNRPSSISRAAGLELEWEAGEGDRIVVVIDTFDTELDSGARISCFADDVGALSIDAELTAGLAEGDETAQLFILRQGSDHIEPEGEGVVIEAAATVSDTVELPLLP